MGAKPQILVMMATYNGAPYVEEQVASILSQEGVEVTLRVCDDQSTDGTLAILEKLAAQDDRMTVTRNATNKGVGMNFMQMVYERHAAPFDYYAFADQDDVWLPEKLVRAVSKLDGIAEPALYYSDVHDFDGAREWSELASYGKVVAHPTTLLVRSWASGCTMVYNHALQEVLCRHEVSEFPRIHDVWVHLVARCCGQVVEDLGHSFIRRRISGRNVVGELTDHHQSLAEAGKDLSNIRHESAHAPSRVATQLREEFGDEVSPAFRRSIHTLTTYRASLASRIRAAMTFDFWQPTLRGRLVVRLCFLLGRY
jgi:glycosyltransferase involved in cell wall biosynthesis